MRVTVANQIFYLSVSRLLVLPCKLAIAQRQQRRFRLRQPLVQSYKVQSSRLEVSSSWFKIPGSEFTLIGFVGVAMREPLLNTNKGMKMLCIARGAQLL
jgi:hypothetical protein